MDLTEGLILSSMMGNGGGSGGGGNPGYHVETENLGTLIPQQTVTTEEQDGIFVGAITITPPESTEPPEAFKVVFDGSTYMCPFDDSSPFIGAQESEDGFDFSEYPFSLTMMDGGALITPASGTYTVQADIVDTQLVIDPEFEEAVNTVVGDSGGSGGSSESELPDYSSSSNAVLAVDSRGETIDWRTLTYTKKASQATSVYLAENKYIHTGFICVSGVKASVKTQINVVFPYDLPTGFYLTLYNSVNGAIEMIYHFTANNTPSVIYDAQSTQSDLTVVGYAMFATA